jgi:hypothetical protein
MKKASCIFELFNDGSDELLLYWEPEGGEYALQPGKAVQIHLFGFEHPLEMKHSVDSRGRKLISFWPLNGSFELYCDGKNMLEM